MKIAFCLFVEISIVYILIVALTSMWTGDVSVNIAEILWTLIIALFVPAMYYVTEKD